MLEKNIVLATIVEPIIDIWLSCHYEIIKFGKTTNYILILFDSTLYCLIISGDLVI